MNSEIIFIIGAGRSGTNILRDTISSLPGIVTWPCDEINLIMRHGNTKMAHDEFGASQASFKTKKFIHQKFESLRIGNSNDTILEKTCANSLRVSFLNEIYPKSKFIFIIRDGYDVAASAKKRWKSSIEVSYLLKKVKYVPVSDIPHYTLRFLRNRVKQFLSKENKMSLWGPIYKGMQKDVKQLSLDEVCAIQWARCTKKAYDDMKEIPSDRTIYLTYEHFVSNPDKIIEQINSWLGYNWKESEILNSVKKVRKGNSRKILDNLKSEQFDKLSSIIDPVMESIYYKVSQDLSKKIKINI